MKSNAAGCGSISTVFSSIVLLCVSSIIIINNNNDNSNNSNDSNDNNSNNSNNNKNDNNSNNSINNSNSNNSNNDKVLLMGCKNTSPIVLAYRKRRLKGNTTTLFPSKKFNTIETYGIWREKNPTAHPNIDFNKLTIKWHIIIKKHLSEMAIDEIKLKVQSKCENRLQNIGTNNNSTHFEQHLIIQQNGDIKSQITPPLQTHVNPEQINNNVQNSLTSEELDIDPQSQPELDERNELKDFG